LLECPPPGVVHWLGGHPEVAAFQHEIMILQRRNAQDLIRRIYKGLPDGPFKRGYKSPSDLENSRVLRLLRIHFPRTKLFIGIRHPVKWFESFYNHRVQNGISMPPAEEINSRCLKNQHGVCVRRSYFHVNLARLGKTRLNGTELALFGEKNVKELMNEKNEFPSYSPSPIFLYDVLQLADKNSSRAQKFRLDLKTYLGLQQNLPPALHSSPGKALPEKEQAARNLLKIDICDDKYSILRNMLVKSANQSQAWIRTYFLESPDVMVSSPAHFEDILDSYTLDPCVPTDTKVE
jgi:hypothetical protein